jgi:hypothetical protein
MLWLLIFTAELMATNGTAFSSNMTTSMNAMMNSRMVNSAGSTSSLTTIFIQVGTYLTTFVNAIFLYSPTVFAGNWFWVWQFICFPISVSFVIVILTIVRGVHAS